VDAPGDFIINILSKCDKALQRLFLQAAVSAALKLHTFRA
jgi:hypothetical protein